MGAMDFYTEGVGKTAKAAFVDAVERALYDSGHGGYTGTIAEKDEFVTLRLPADKEAYSYAEELVNNGDRRVDNKWGPAGCIKLDGDRWLFFGWASS